ncbi:hypothetical protein EG329_010852 [Mollisiaceae sp. DMI_Dod_QoI]|nr:hypothetical protein EG329_010852 [Helotiales sp. DMI_Dod_QoI]
MSEVVVASSTTNTSTSISACRIYKPASSATLGQWWAILKKRMALQLHLLDLSTSQTAATIMHTMRKKYDSIRPSRPCWLTQVKIPETIVSSYHIGDPEAQDYPREIFLTSNEYLSDLTDAFPNPNIPRRAANLTYLNKHFNILRGHRAPGHGDASYPAILITNDGERASWRRSSSP